MIIEKFINTIYKDRVYNEDGKDTYWYFKGDGTGDFEELGEETTVECLNYYIEYCKEQIRLAEEYLKLKENKK